ncbi:hypothetical protein [Roseateles sp.]|uniref:hypothetical protein n=1 Tax=Roseateles sp. TaxID=1971397 RepID=UPI0039E7C48B
MTIQLAALAQASVLQLRDAIRRVTALHVAAAEAPPEDEFLAGIEAGEMSWSDWEETNFDVRQFHV